MPSLAPLLRELQQQHQRDVKTGAVGTEVPGVHDKMRVNNVAYEVGYESPSQFSREFKRYFKVPPSEAHALA